MAHGSRRGAGGRGAGGRPHLRPAAARPRRRSCARCGRNSRRPRRPTPSSPSRSTACSRSCRTSQAAAGRGSPTTSRLNSLRRGWVPRWRAARRALWPWVRAQAQRFFALTPTSGMPLHTGLATSPAFRYDRPNRIQTARGPHVEDQGSEPRRRTRRRRDDPDHLGLHQAEADPALSRHRPEILRPRDRGARPHERPDHRRCGECDQAIRRRREMRDDHARTSAGRGIRPEADVENARTARSATSWAA